MPIACQQAVFAGASLVAKADPVVLIAQPGRQLAQNLGPVLEMPSWQISPPRPLSETATRHRRLVHIQPNIRDRVHPARLPCMRLCAGQPGTTLDILHAEVDRRSLSEHKV